MVVTLQEALFCFPPGRKNPRLHMRFETNGLVHYRINFLFENLLLSEKVDVKWDK